LSFEDSLKALKLLLVVDGDFVAVARDGAYIFEIRPKENGHNVPHFHVNAPDFNLSISLVDFKCLAAEGKLTKARLQNIIQFAKDHYDELKSMWVELHQWKVV